MLEGILRATAPEFHHKVFCVQVLLQVLWLKSIAPCGAVLVPPY